MNSRNSPNERKSSNSRNLSNSRNSPHSINSPLIKKTTNNNVEHNENTEKVEE